MRKILVTGGAGNVGGSLTKKLVTDPDNFVVTVDDLSTGSVNNYLMKDSIAILNSSKQM